MTAALNKLAKDFGVNLPESINEIPAIEVREVPAEISLSEVGQVGTRYSGKNITIEPTTKYRPVYVRGKSGNPRIYESYYRGEPLILDAVQSYTELLVAGTYDLQPPEDTPEMWLPAVQEFCDYYRRRLFQIRGGWQNFVEHAASCLIFGFAPFEMVWHFDADGHRYPGAIAYREPSTVEGWYLDETGNYLEAVEFKTGGYNGSTYTLPASDLLLVNLNARGLNFEGIPPIRPAIHWIQTKRILGQIAPLTASKYGVPIIVVKNDPAYGNEYGPGGTDKASAATVRAVFTAMHAGEAPNIELPDGLMAEVLAPAGAMPDLQPLIQYCDQMITTAFSNEGALLGMQSQVGSYALSEQKERDFLRSAPYYARRVLAPINEMLRELAAEWFGDQMPPSIPEMVYRVDGMKDSSRWLDDVNKLLPNGAWMQVPEVAKAVFKELGLDVRTIESVTVDEEEE